MKNFLTDLGKNIFLGDKKSSNVQGKVVDMTDFFNGPSEKEPVRPATSTNVSDTVRNHVSFNNTNASINTNNNTNSTNTITNSNLSIVNSNNTQNIPNKIIDKEDYLLTEEHKKNIIIVKKEFNDLSDLLNVKTTNEGNTFKLDLFKMKSSHNKNSYITSSNEQENDNDDIIEIERESNIDQIKNKFEDCFKIEESGKNQCEDDLLDLMDMASGK